MDLSEIEARLGVIASAVGDAEVNVGSRGRLPHRVAVIKLTPLGNPNDFAEITVSAGGWLSIEVPGGFSHNTLVELSDTDEVLRSLDQFLEVGIAYVHGSRTREVSKLHVPHVVVRTASGDVRLELAIRDQLMRLFRLRS